MTTVLAIETTTNIGSVAVIRDSEVLRVITLTDGMKHGRMLMPTVSDILKSTGINLSAVDVVAASIGPGSYTGTRVGVMAAKALAFGAGIKAVPVSSLAGIALAAGEQGKIIVPALDARRDELYTAVYGFDAEGFPLSVKDDIALSPEETAALAAEYGEDCIVVGNGWQKYPEVFSPLEQRRVTLSCSLPAPSAGEIGLLAAHAIDHAIDPLALEAVYLRRDDVPCTFERFMS